MDQIANTPRMRAQILAMIMYSDWLGRYGTIILPEYMQTQDEKDLVKWINEYYDKYKSAPGEAALEEKFGGSDLLDALRAAATDITQYDADYALDFARAEAMKVAVLNAVDNINNNELHLIRPCIEDALKVGQDRLAVGYDLVADAEQWMYDELHGKRYCTGWRSVDRALGGGLVGGEYGLILAPPNMGKTTALINIGYAAAGLVGAANVLHLTYEMPASKVLKRYALRVTGQTMSRTGTSGTYAQVLRDRAKQNMRAKLRVIRPDDVSVDNIRRLLDNLHQSVGFQTQVLIVDYADLLDPPRKMREHRFELEAIARGLREIGYDYNIPVWSASQAGRQGYGKKWVTMQDIAEAIGKAAIADVIIGVCQTQDEQELGQGRLFMAKVRDGESRFPVSVKIDYANQAIVERGRFDE